MVWLSRNATLDISAFVPKTSIIQIRQLFSARAMPTCFFVVSGLHVCDVALFRAKQTVVGFTEFVDDDSIASTI